MKIYVLDLCLSNVISVDFSDSIYRKKLFSETEIKKQPVT